jgi:hypothetical protein
MFGLLDGICVLQPAAEALDFETASLKVGLFISTEAGSGRPIAFRGHMPSWRRQPSALDCVSPDLEYPVFRTRQRPLQRRRRQSGSERLVFPEGDAVHQAFAGVIVKRVMLGRAIVPDRDGVDLPTQLHPDFRPLE